MAPLETFPDTPPSPQPSSTTTTTTTITSATSSPLNFTEINAGQYQALLEEDTDYFNDQETDFSELARVSDSSSILHIAASTDQNERMIKLIHKRSSTTLLTRPDSKGDLPVHVAVRAGHIRVVDDLIILADQQENGASLMLEKVNNENNTALHIALENQQLDMARLLFGKCPQVCNRLNKQKISPLYLAIKAGFWDLVGNMISRGNNSSLRISEDDFLKHSVIHAAIMARNRDILEKIIEEYPDELLLSMDEKGRRPLSYAASIGFLDGVDCIINMKEEDDNRMTNFPYRSQAFKADQDGSAPIHAACSGGHMKVIKKLLYTMPHKMRWLLNQKGQSILHVAAQSGKAEVVEYLLKQPNLETMINMKDNEGYTPLHLGTLGKHPKVVYVLTWDSRTKLNLQCKNGFTALDIAQQYGADPSFEERLTWLALIYAGVPRSPEEPIEQIEPNMSPIPNGVVLSGKTTLFVTEQGQLQAIKNHPKKRKNKTYKERINTLLIISTLIATVTFASGFTVPGGYNNSNPKQGMATLDHTWAFQVFAITNTIAMYTSILAMVTLIWAHLDDVRLIMVSLEVALPLIGTALSTMLVAFLAGLYVVLDDVVVLGIVMLVMGGVFLAVLLVFLIPLYSPTTYFKYRFMRYVTHIPFKLMLLACANPELV